MQNDDGEIQCGYCQMRLRGERVVLQDPPSNVPSYSVCSSCLIDSLPFDEGEKTRNVELWNSGIDITLKHLEGMQDPHLTYCNFFKILEVMKEHYTIYEWGRTEKIRRYMTDNHLSTEVKRYMADTLSNFWEDKSLLSSSILKDKELILLTKGTQEVESEIKKHYRQYLINILNLKMTMYQNLHGAAYPRQAEVNHKMW